MDQNSERLIERMRERDLISLLTSVEKLSKNYFPFLISKNSLKKEAITGNKKGKGF